MMFYTRLLDIGHGVNLCHLFIIIIIIIIIIIVCRDSFIPSGRGSHAKGILTIFSKLMREMMNSVGPVMAS